MLETRLDLGNGAQVVGNQVQFRVWAPAARRLSLVFTDGRVLPMQPGDDGAFSLLADARAGDCYFVQVEDHRPVPDPVSRLLPSGVHGPTEIVDPSAFTWTDQDWRGVPLSDYLIYELHPGTFTPQGTFDAIGDRLLYLRTLGVTILELMPVAAFPGTRNWGYDMVSPYAVQASYGGPDGLKRLIDQAHSAGLGVVLDVVYNHLGNEGNYLRWFGPYFTPRHHTPWGEAINYDGPGSEHVRRYVVENVLYWIREYHADGLRLDAVQTIKDDSAYPIVEEISDQVHRLAAELGRAVTVIAETDENDSRLVRPKPAGYGLDALWSDDFHHAIHAALTGELSGYYQDFGRLEQIAHALNDGFVFQGDRFAYWNAPRGNSPEGVPLAAHVICVQNHDQVGNRAQGERLGQVVPAGARHLAAALLLLAPQTPLLFMGQEWDASVPFQFFTDFGDPALQQAVRDGRRREFKDFAWSDVPDPQSPDTYARSRLDWSEVTSDNPMLSWYRQLIHLRRQYVLGGERTCHAELHNRNLVLQVPRTNPCLLLIAGFPGRKSGFDPPDSAWKIALDNDADGYRTRVFTK